MTPSRKIAVVINATWKRQASIDFDGYCRELLRLGHSPVLVCCASERVEHDFPVVEAGASEMEEERFWRAMALDGIIFFNWLRAPRIVAAMKAAGLFVISRGDTDGLMSARVFPQAAWLALENEKKGILDWLQKRQWWVRRCLIFCKINDPDLLDTIDRTDAVAIECDEAEKNLFKILSFYKRSELGKKLHVIPHSVSDEILQQNIPIDQKERSIICGGRWDDPQKDAHLLAASLELVLKKQSDLAVTIVGDGAEHLFGPLTRRFPKVRWLRRVARQEMARLLAQNRIILSSSRWEGYSIITLEALCQGCTLVSPPLPGFVSMSEKGRYGTIAPTRNPSVLANAIAKELELWDNGSRNPAEISAVWRRRTDNRTVVGDLLSLMP